MDHTKLETVETVVEAAAAQSMEGKGHMEVIHDVVILGQLGIVHDVVGLLTGQLGIVCDVVGLLTGSSLQTLRAGTETVGSHWMTTVNVIQSSKLLVVDCMAYQWKIERMFATPSGVITTRVTGPTMDGKVTLPSLHQNLLGQLTVGNRMAGMMMVTTFAKR